MDDVIILAMTYALTAGVYFLITIFAVGCQHSSLDSHELALTVSRR